MARKNTLVKRTCKACKQIEHTSQGANTSFDTLTTEHEQWGHRLQRAGAEMSITMGGHKKGGFAMQSQRGMRKKTKLFCVNCGSDRIKTELVKVKVADAIKLLGNA